MNPYPYNIVDLGGIDLATLNGEPIDGIYNKILDAMTPCKIVIFSNWYFASILIAPSYVVIDDSTENQLVINDLILVTSDDEVSIPSMEGDPTIEAITFTQNGIYTAPIGVDGYSPITVAVPPILPVLEELSVSANGQYSPPQGVDGFSNVSVNVPQILPDLEELSVTNNGQYLPSQGKDGFSKVVVNVSQSSPTVPQLPAEYQEVEYLLFSGNAWFEVASPPTGNGVIFVDAEQDNLTQNSMICGYRTSTTVWFDWNVGSSGEGQRWYFRGNDSFVFLPTITPSGNRVTTSALMIFGGTASTQAPSVRPFFIGNYYNNSGSTAYGPMKGKIFYVRILNPVNNSWFSCYVPCYRKSDNTVGMYDPINSVFYTKSGTGTITPGPDKN